MLVSEPGNAPVDSAQRASFFRQSGWLMVANIAGGFFMWAVHLLNQFIPPGAYGDFGVFLAVIMLVPTIPLQMVMAQQTAKALAIGRESELASVIRWMWLGTTLLWVLGAAGVALFQNSILGYLQMGGANGLLWITMAIVLLSLWMPIFMGALQGKQNFLWLGWVMMSNALGRITIAALAVLAFRTFEGRSFLSSGPSHRALNTTLYASGMIAGVLFGMVLAVVLGLWHTRGLWLSRPQPFPARTLLQQIVPLFVGFLGFQMLFTADTIFIKAYFSNVQSDYYVSAGTLSRALMWLVLPLAAVMFPRIVHSAARAEKTNLVNLVLLGTAVLAIAGAAGLSLVGPWIVPLIYKNQNPQVIMSLLPWYASAMVPLAVANVLLNNLLARPASKLLPSVCILLVAVGYVLAVLRFHHSMIEVLQTMGVCNLLLLGVCAWFTWAGKSHVHPPSAEPA
jgi:O-antigen/teichoic acid export membrane protein